MIKQYRFPTFCHRLQWLLLAAVATLMSLGCEWQSDVPRPSTSPSANSTTVPATQTQSSENVAAGLAEALPPDEPRSQSMLAAPSKALSSLAQTISQAYESAKSQGQTAATSARDWLLDDLQSSNRWEYKILTLAESDPAQLERELNDLGRDGWQCFHVQPQGESLLLFFQRHPSSISRNIPMSDLLKVLPYLGLGQGNR